MIHYQASSFSPSSPISKKKESHNNKYLVKAKRKEKSKFHAAKQSIQLPKPRLIPCKARGVPGKHDETNAYIKINPNTKHGTVLTCSNPNCVAIGRLFQFCAVCQIPVSKSNFIKRHSHDFPLEMMKLMTKNLPFSDDFKGGTRESIRQLISKINDEIHDLEDVISHQIKAVKSMPSTNDLTEQRTTKVVIESFDTPLRKNKAIFLRDKDSLESKHPLNGKKSPLRVSVEVTDEELRWISLYRQRPTLMANSMLSKSEKYLFKEEKWLEEVEKQSKISFMTLSPKCFSTISTVETHKTDMHQSVTSFESVPFLIDNDTSQKYNDEDDSSSDLSEVDIASLQEATTNRLDRLCNSPLDDFFSLFDS